MKLFTLTLLFVCIASGQNKNNIINDIPNVYVIIVDKDSLPSYSLYLPPEMRDSKLAKQWKMINELLFENDSLRQDNERLKLLYDKTLGMARKYRRDVDSLINVSKTTTSPSQTKPKTLKPAQGR